MIVHGEELLVPVHLNFGKFFLDRLRKSNPDDTCWIDYPTGDKVSYGEFTQHAVSVSAALAQLGVARGDTVAVAGEPRPTFMPTALAVVLAGATYTPIGLNCGRAILTHQLELSKPKYVICSSLFWTAYKDILTGLEFIKTFICFDDNDDIKLSIATMASRDVDVTTFEPVAVDGATDVAIVTYSSGTTGVSKGVQLTHLNCIAGASITWYSDTETLKTVLLIGELSSIYTIYMLCFFLTTGKRILYTETGFHVKTLQDYQVNTFPTVPADISHMVEDVEHYDLSSLKTVYSGGDRLHPEIIESFKQRYPHIALLQIYGSTEMGIATISSTTQQRNPGNINTTTSVGGAAPGVMLKVVDIQTRAILGPNQRGEICVRGPCLMKGYLGATSPYLDDEGFFLTGDLGYYDDHKQFYLVDRLKDIISYVGYKVAPKELESVLLTHPAVCQAAVVGKPAGALGELPAAFVVLHPGTKVSETELVDYVTKEVSSFMQLRGGLRFVSAIPRNSRKKVLRRQLRDMLEVEEPRNNATEAQSI